MSTYRTRTVRPQELERRVRALMERLNQIDGVNLPAPEKWPGARLEPLAEEAPTDTIHIPANASNKEDAKLLGSSRRREEMAEAILNALYTHFNEKPVALSASAAPSAANHSPCRSVCSSAGTAGSATGPISTSFRWVST